MVLGCLNGAVLEGDLCDVRVGINVSLDNQPPVFLLIVPKSPS